VTAGTSSIHANGGALRAARERKREKEGRAENRERAAAAASTSLFRLQWEKKGRGRGEAATSFPSRRVVEGVEQTFEETCLPISFFFCPKKRGGGNGPLISRRKEKARGLLLILCQWAKHQRKRKRHSRLLRRKTPFSLSRGRFRRGGERKGGKDTFTASKIEGEGEPSAYLSLQLQKGDCPARGEAMRIAAVYLFDLVRAKGKR